MWNWIKFLGNLSIDFCLILIIQWHNIVWYNNFNWNYKCTISLDYKTCFTQEVFILRTSESLSKFKTKQYSNGMMCLRNLLQGFLIVSILKCFKKISIVNNNNNLFLIFTYNHYMYMVYRVCKQKSLTFKLKICAC